LIGITWQHVRLFLHVLAAALWVGGQFTLAGLVPALRQLGGDAPGVVARRFARVAWPAFAVLVLTGLWNLGEVSLSDRGGQYKTTLVVKLVVVALSGVGAFLHQRARSRAGLAVWGAVSALAALGSLLLGVVLHG